MKKLINISFYIFNTICIVGAIYVSGYICYFAYQNYMVNYDFSKPKRRHVKIIKKLDNFNVYILDDSSQCYSRIAITPTQWYSWNDTQTLYLWLSDKQLQLYDK